MTYVENGSFLVRGQMGMVTSCILRVMTLAALGNGTKASNLIGVQAMSSSLQVVVLVLEDSRIHLRSLMSMGNS